MSKDNDFHWILYSVFRASFLISLLFATVVIVSLYLDVEILTERIVVRKLQFFAYGTSASILLGIIPYHYVKTKNVIGFSSVDFMESFSRRAPRAGWALDRKKIIRKTKIIFLFFSLVALPLGWMSIAMILNHYHSIDSLFAISSALFVYSILGNSTVSIILLFFLMIHQQYKSHFKEIPSKNLTTIKE